MPATFICWQLSQHPDALNRLWEELKDRFPRQVEPQGLMNLPYLDAVIRETMRVMPTVPGPLERYLPEDVTINGLRVSGRITS